MTIRARLDKDSPRVAVATAGLSSARSRARARVIVIDDDPNIRELLTIHLNNSGYQVLAAEDAVVGGRMIMQARPDLIICDVNMPYLDGFEFVEAMKGDPATRDIPVVMLSSEDDPTGRASRLGVAAYLKKPVQAGRLLEVVALFADLAQEPTEARRS
jgi:CheY-like chemotaxis protein